VPANNPNPLHGARRGEHPQWERFFETEGGNGGLASADRNNKTTLPRTAPYYRTRSYAKVLSPRIVKLQDVSQYHGLPPQHRCQPAKIQGQGPIRIRLRCVGENRRVLAWILT
jgi:hypothetical protein